MDDLTLQALAANLPPKAPAGTAEMLLLLLVYREMESRSRRSQDTNVLPFPPAHAGR
ncbi:msl4726 [Mesorhizobium japonicum MAFF 303099]|uniref:Msl4726 protein n=1 Tax=Mesorhizobium japonicum (strain LMG 29417 / CECT 9101 / MAFF 303099) TaxID=266835 RepID=Q98DF5_RHILO|nr:msl4726 [Mesorhizobium japonicum MAFF 303099]